MEPWTVENMTYEPCMYKIIIDGRTTFINVWTDDVDGVCEDPRDSQLWQLIRDKFDELRQSRSWFKFRLRQQREWTSDNGVAVAKHEQVA